MLMLMSVSLLPLLLAGGITTYYVYQEARHRAEDDLLSEAIDFAGQTDDYFTELAAEMRFVAGHFDQHDLYGSNNLRFLSSFVSVYNDIRTVWLISGARESKVLYSREEMLADVSLPEQIRQPGAVTNRREVAWHSPRQDTPGIENIYAWVPVITPWQEQSAGVLYFKILPEKIKSITKRAKEEIPGNANAYIVDEYDHLISHSNRKILVSADQEDFHPPRQGPSGAGSASLSIHSHGDADYLVVSQQVKSLPWSVYIEKEKKDVYQLPNRLLKLFSALFGLIILLVIPLAALFSIRLVRPVSRLAETARELAAGKFSARADVTAQNEIGILADSFNRMVDFLRQREEQYRQLVETAPHGIQENDLDGIIIYSNPAHHRMLGYDHGELVSKPIWEVQSSDAAKEKLRQYFAVLVKEQPAPAPSISKCRTKDGRIVDVRVDWDYMRDASGRLSGFISIITDITENIQALENLSRAHAYNEIIIDAMFDSICIINTSDFTIQRANRSFLKKHGVVQQDLLGKTCHEITHHLSAPCPGDESCPCPLVETLKTGKAHIVEHQHYNKDNGKIYEEVGTAPIRNEKGEITQVLHISRDITDYKLLQEQLLQAQKMESIGRLAGGVAHDFNNLLTIILGYGELALLKSNIDESLREPIKAIYAAGEKAASLTQQLLAFSRKQVLQMRVVEPNSLIADIVTMLIRLVGEDIQINLKTQAHLGNIMADPSQFEQILMNLAVNARDAMPEGGMMTIGTSAVELDAGYPENHLGVEPGPYILISVSDTGCGMTRDVQKKIFEPFYTTKEQGKGTGLGLSTIYGIVKQHNGHIYVYSEPGRGTTFKMYFPALAEAIKEPLPQKKSQELPGGAETIFVVDDDPTIVKYIEDVLTALGYRLLCANSSREATDLIETMDENVDLLLTDVIMPDMNGPELAEKLRAKWPEIKVVFMSGYTDDIIVRQGVLEPGVILFDKPLMPDMLANRLREILDKEQ